MRSRKDACSSVILLQRTEDNSAEAAACGHPRSTSLSTADALAGQGAGGGSPCKLARRRDTTRSHRNGGGAQRAAEGARPRSRHRRNLAAHLIRVLCSGLRHGHGRPRFAAAPRGTHPLSNLLCDAGEARHCVALSRKFAYPRSPGTLSAQSGYIFEDLSNTILIERISFILVLFVDADRIFTDSLI